MSVTQPDIAVSPYLYMDIYKMQQVPPGTRGVLQNKSVIPMHVQIGIPGKIPAPKSTDGSYVQPYEYLELRPDPGETIYVRSVGNKGFVSLQVRSY